MDHLDLRLEVPPITGDAVRKLHLLLKRVGYLVTNAEADPPHSFGQQTEDKLKLAQSDAGLVQTGIFDLNTEAALRARAEWLCQLRTPLPEQLVVRGKVMRARGGAVASATVTVSVLGLRDTTFPIDTVVTGDCGSYELTYANNLPGYPFPAIVVHVDDGFGVTADVRSYRPGPETVVDVVIGGTVVEGPSEYERVVAVVAPLLMSPDGQTQWNLAQFQGQDARFAADAQGFDPAAVTHLIAAKAAEALTVVINDHNVHVDAEAYFAWFREGLPTRPIELLALPSERLQAALDHAIARNTICEHPLEWRVEQVENAAGLGASLLLDVDNPDGFGVLFEAAFVEPSNAQAYVAGYIQNEGTSDDLWAALAAGPIGAAGVAQLKLAFEWGALTLNHPPMVQLLRGTHPNPRAVVTAAAATPTYWSDRIADLVGDSEVAVPPRLMPGQPEPDRRAAYAALLAQSAAELYPTATVIETLRPQGGVGLQIAQFFDAHPELDLRTAPLLRADLVTELGAAAPDAQRLQRLHRVGRDAVRTKALYAANLDSAQQIAQLDAASLVTVTGLSQSDAKEIQKQARAQVDLGAALYFKFGPAAGNAIVPAIGNLNDALQANPTLAELVGRTPLCGCEECQSIFSPAAYLVDLFEFIKRFSTDAWTTLVASRPDLQDLQLSCDNTNIPLPYIDLVNEILENLVLGSAPVARQTTHTADELRANPEYIQTTAYETRLKTAIYPFALPFDLAREEATIYLDHLGTSRAELFDESLPHPDWLTSDAYTREILGLTTTEYQLITTDAGVTAGSPMPRWGNATAAQLQNAGELLRRAGLEAKDLPPLLSTDFVNPSHDLGTSSADSYCDPDTTTLAHLPANTPITETDLDRICRFVRLWRRLGWTMQEVDDAIRLGGNGFLFGGFLDELAYLVELKRLLKLPVRDLFVWQWPIDTHLDPEGRSHYDTVFLDRVASTANDPATDPLRLNAARTELAVADPGPAPTLQQHLTRVAAALGIRPSDVAALEPVTSLLNRATLSRVYRRWKLCRALRIKPVELPVWESLLTSNAFGAGFHESVQFVRNVRLFQPHAISIAEFDFLFHNREILGTPMRLTDADVAALFGDLRAKLQAIAAATVAARSETDVRALVRRKLEPLLPAADYQQVLLLLDGDPSAPYGSAAALLAPILMPGDNVSALDSPPASQGDTDILPRYALLVEPILRTVERAERIALVERLVADTFSVAAEMAATLVRAPFQSADGEARDVLTDQSVSDPGVAISSLAAAARTLRRLQKLALIVTRLSLEPDEIQYLHTNRVDFFFSDLMALPVDGESLALHFDDFFGLLLYAEACPMVRGTRVPLYPNLQLARATPTPTLQQVVTDLAVRTGWDKLDAGVPQDLYALIRQMTAGMPDPVEPFKTPIGIVIVGRAVTLARRLGISLARVITFMGELDLTVSAEIKNAVKAKYDRATWLTLSKDLRDPLRERQRDALVAYLVGNGFTPSGGGTTIPFSTANDLFALYHIDVEMSACQPTSRVKQAISATQLFIQTCILRPAPGSDLGPVAAAQWKWMYAYRIWEANRRIFAYPENWLEIDLLDEKSPPFVELEQELSQKDITNDTAEAALKHYLEKLNEVARLEMIGMVRQKDAFLPEGEQDVTTDTTALHLFGRTRSTPHVYYYRRLERGWKWTPWERIDVDLVGDHVLPVLWHRRLFLFWLVTTEKRKPAQQAQDENDKSMHDPATMLEISLAWTERKDERWLARKSSRAKVTLDDDREALGRLTLNWYTGADLHIVLTHRRITDQLQITQDSNNLIQSSFNKKIEDLAAEFAFSGCGDEPTARDFQPAQRAFDPPDTEPDAMAHVQADGSFAFHWGQSANDPDNRDPRKFKRPFLELWVLDATPSRYRVVYPHHYAQFSSTPFTYEDDSRVFLVESADGPLSSSPEKVNQQVSNHIKKAADDAPAWETIPDSAMTAQIAPLFFGLPDSSQGLVVSRSFDNGAPAVYRFSTLYHPYTCQFLERLSRYGVRGFYAWGDDPAQEGITPVQELTPAAIQGPLHYSFDVNYAPNDVVEPYPVEEVDFSACGSYAQYNWELFFHIPILIATRLQQNQRFEEARDWFQYVFNPAASGPEAAPARYWKMARLKREDPNDTTIQELLEKMVEGEDPQAEESCDIVHFADQVREWRNHPFSPYAVARMRVSAYQRMVVKRYIENLIAWGDQLFRRETLEEINRATLLYIEAAQILGKKPEGIPTHPDDESQPTYAELVAAGSLGPFSDQLENLLPPSARADSEGARYPVSAPPGLVFCVPPNDQFLALWDTVADRLFKIRHCMNIEGAVRQLPLFEPRLDPGLLARAAAAGVDLASAAFDVPPSPYRATVLMQKTGELLSELKQLGQSMLSSLEKQDAEELATLRSSHEVAVLEAAREVRLRQVREAQTQLDAWQETRTAIQTRVSFYKSRQKVNVGEGMALTLSGISGILQVVAQGLTLSSSSTSLIPDINVGGAGIFGSPIIIINPPLGAKMSTAMERASTSLQLTAGHFSNIASMTATLAGYERRKQEWDMMGEAGTAELANADKQIVAAAIRLEIAQQDLTNHDLQIENAREYDRRYREKFTNRALYSWMVGQISTLYFRTYQLAFDMSRRAELAFRQELALHEGAPFIQFGAWDNLKSGLLAGEKLSADLRRMEAAYYEENRREIELTKNVSLALLDPIALQAFRDTGSCMFKLTEELYDADMPGLLLRRLRTVGVTLECEVGPNTAVVARLTLVRHSVRIKTGQGADGYPRNAEGDDARFVEQPGGESIITSTGQNDHGLHEVNLRDERRLPFEWAGAISEWKLERVKELPQLDWTELSDVVLQVRYTAREGGAIQRANALDHLNTVFAQGLRYLSGAADLKAAFEAFLHPVTGERHTLAIDFTRNRIAFLQPTDGLNVTRMVALVLWTAPSPTSALQLKLKPPGASTELSSTQFPPASPPADDGLAAEWGGYLLPPAQSFADAALGSDGTWQLFAEAADIAALPAELRQTVDENGTPVTRLRPERVRDVLLLFEYEKVV